MHELRKVALGTAISLGVAAAVAPTLAAQEIDAPQVHAMADPTVVIELNGAAHGTAVLRAAGDQTDIAIDLAGAPTGEALEAYLISGTCAEDGELVARLGTVEIDAEGNGQLEAGLGLPLETVTSAPIAVAVQAEGALDGETVACGAHTAERETELPAAPPAPEPAPEPLPEEPTEDPLPLPEPTPPL